MNESTRALKEAIDDLENGFWDEDEVHAFEIRMDSLSSALSAYLESKKPGCTDELYEYQELFEAAGLNDEVIDSATKLMELVELIDYGESRLTARMLRNANGYLENLHQGIKKWFTNENQNLSS